MITAGFLWLWLVSVTPSPGWSTPVVVTEEGNSSRPELHLNIDDQDRFHLIWSGYGDESRIGYKAFLLDGTTVYPDTMISLDSHSALVSRAVMGDSIFVFWRDYNPIYYCICKMSTGEVVTPATYLFSTSTLYPYIRACPDSLGRLHVLYNDGDDVRYAVWTPAPGSGFTVERDWKIEGADAGGVLLVDGNRVHIVVNDPVYHDFCYLQYDLDGNTTIPLIDFTTTGGDLECSRFPELGLDPGGNLMVVEDVVDSCWTIALWKIDCYSGLTMINMKHIVDESPPIMYFYGDYILRGIPGTDLFYLIWTDSQTKQALFLLMDGNGNVIVDWAQAYDYSDEDPESLPFVSGEADEDGNLYIAYEQIDPVLGYFPTFGWFDYNYVSKLQQEAQVESSPAFSLSSNPVTGSVTVYTSSGSNALRVFDISGREVSEISVSDGVGVWNGTGFSGERLPAGIYNIVGEDQFHQRVTLLER